MGAPEATHPEAILALAVDAAREAGALLLDRFGGPASGVVTKSTRTDMVSDADRDAEAIILGAIRDARPGDHIVAEESGESASGDPDALTWLVDPLDGTVNYLWGFPHWCVSIQVAGPTDDVAAVVFDACRDELFTAVPGRCELNGRPLHLSESDDLGDALVATGFAYLAERRRLQAEIVARLLPRVRDIRRAGSAALDLAWVAAGRVDAYFEFGPEAWDFAAGAMLVRQAGGVTTPLAALGDGATGLAATRPGLDAKLIPLVTPAG